MPLSDESQLSFARNQRRLGIVEKSPSSAGIWFRKLAIMGLATVGRDEQTACLLARLLAGTIEMAGWADFLGGVLRMEGGGFLVENR